MNKHFSFSFKYEDFNIMVVIFFQAAQDGVDILSLSITPNRKPPGVATFFNPIDMALLSAVKAGIFVVQAAGNTGPAPKTMSSFSPWIFTVGASSHDRVYSNSLTLGNNVTIPGMGFASKSLPSQTITFNDSSRRLWIYNLCTLFLYSSYR